MQPQRSQGDPFAVIGEFPGAQRTWLWCNVMITCWYGTPSAAAADRLAEWTEPILASLPPSAKISYVHLITSKLKMPDAATRSSLLASTQRYASRSGVSGVVVPGGGFWASAIRSFVTGIAVLAPRELDLRIFGAIPELVPWFAGEHAKRTGVHIDGDELMRLLEEAAASCAAP
ncbi:MAG TPA: hypothetical protein VJV78_40205 [Polyangiales bacterium]|nr:hypothetical protein [Polyangiales bacterium]